MAYEMRPNTGSLFKNDKKETENHPDYKGSALIDGREFWLDAWINESSSGTKYMSLKVKAKEARQEPANGYGRRGDAPTNIRSQSFRADLEDDVPFATNDPALESRVR